MKVYYNEAIKDRVSAVGGGGNREVTLTTLAGTLNQYAGKYMVVTMGDQANTSSLIASNTAATPTVLTVSDDQNANLIDDTISIQPSTTTQWIEITAIVDFPQIITRNNSYGVCTVKIRDFEGALYGTEGVSGWNIRDFTDMIVDDDNNNRLFRGFLIRKTYTADALVLELVGFAILLDWIPFYKSYILAEGLVKTSAASSVLTMWRDVDKDEVYDGGGEDFNWAVDKWITDQDVGLLIVDNTSDLDSEIWQCSTITTTNANEGGGNKDSLDAQDGNSYYIWELNNNWIGYTTIVLGEGNTIPTTKKIHSIKINYRIGIKCGGYRERHWFLHIKNSDGEWIEILHIPTRIGQYEPHWEEGEFLIPKNSDNELKKFLTVDGANYDEVSELQMSWSCVDPLGSNKAEIWIDELTATIKYYTDEINPVMERITDSAANTITCSGIPDFVATGVIGYDDTAPGDIFKIGENTRTIVGNIATAIGIPIEIIGQEGTEAGTEVLRPDGDTTTQFQYHSNSGGDGTHWKDIDEVVVDPNAGDGNIIRSHAGAANTDQFTFGTFAIPGSNVITKLELKVYYKNDIVYFGRVNIYTTSTGWIEEKYMGSPDYAWGTFTWDNLNLSQADIDNLQVKFWTTQTIFPAQKLYIDTVYVVATYGVYAPFDKFIARIYRGTHCIDALKSVCDIEGADWMEDYVNYRIKLVKPSAYEVSNVVLTEADYGPKWEFEDECNQVKRFDVYGCVSYAVLNKEFNQIPIDPYFLKWIRKLNLENENIEFYKRKKSNLILIGMGYDFIEDVWQIEYAIINKNHQIIHKLGYLWFYKELNIINTIKKNIAINKEDINVKLGLPFSLILDTIIYRKLFNMDKAFRTLFIKDYVRVFQTAFYEGTPDNISIFLKISCYIEQYLMYNYLYPEEIKQEYCNKILYELLIRQNEILEESDSISRKVFRETLKQLRKFDSIKDSENLVDITNYTIELCEQLPYWDRDYLKEQIRLRYGN